MNSDRPSNTVPRPKGRVFHTRRGRSHVWRRTQDRLQRAFTPPRSARPTDVCWRRRHPRCLKVLTAGEIEVEDAARRAALFGDQHSANLRHEASRVGDEPPRQRLVTRRRDPDRVLPGRQVESVRRTLARGPNRLAVERDLRVERHRLDDEQAGYGRPNERADMSAPIAIPSAPTATAPLPEPTATRRPPTTANAKPPAAARPGVARTTRAMTSVSVRR